MKIFVLVILSLALIIFSSMSAGASESDFRVRLTVGLINWDPALIFSISPASATNSSLSEVEIRIVGAYNLDFQPNRNDVRVISQNCFKVEFDQDHNSAQFWAIAEDLKPYLKKFFSLTIKNGSKELVYSVKVEYTLTDIPFKGRFLTTWGRVKT